MTDVIFAIHRPWLSGSLVVQLCVETNQTCHELVSTGKPAVLNGVTLLSVATQLFAVTFSGQRLLHPALLTRLQIERWSFYSLMMSSCKTFRLNLRRAFSSVSPS